LQAWYRPISSGKRDSSAHAFLDTSIGAIPLVGDAFDVLFRANMKNMALLRRHLEKKGYTQPLRGTVIEGDAVRVR
jgi:hypothetical protein